MSMNPLSYIVSIPLIVKKKQEDDKIKMNGCMGGGLVVLTLTRNSFSVGFASSVCLSWCRMISSCCNGDNGGLLKMSGILRRIKNEHGGLCCEC